MPAAQPASPRHDGVDLFKNLALLSVITLHLAPLVSSSGALGTAGIILHAGCRWAVPFFFLASGYYVAGSSGRAWKRMVAAILLWNAGYALLPGAMSALHHRSPEPLRDYLVAFTHNLTTNPADILAHGAFFHLWFLTALLAARGLVTLSLRVGHPATFAGIAAAAAALAIAFHPVSYVEGDLTGYDLVLRNVLFASASTAAGAAWASTRARHRWRPGTVPLVSAVLVVALEFLWHWHRGAAVLKIEFLATGPLLGWAVFSVAERLPAVFRKAGAWLPRRTLGIYSVHAAVVIAVIRLTGERGPFVQLLLVPIVFVASIALTALVRRVPVIGALCT